MSGRQTSMQEAGGEGEIMRHEWKARLWLEWKVSWVKNSRRHVEQPEGDNGNVRHHQLAGAEVLLNRQKRY